ncbi:uncharacterized protein N7473_000661 [Penicillium subrubescens]|uniref:uncharacterized protein n=1 Tax=Penicillium subrubescens TaxID=1316194 RepID=UPI0025456F1D|nr:uncharacterized protein N7473_000661 [Penicillium subrubescens]KAJ5911358.1 hypothetical protein N7473_000661 [Penicillium subrubescens]
MNGTTPPFSLGEKLAAVVTELILSNADEQPTPSSCAESGKTSRKTSGKTSYLPKFRAPDRRPTQLDDLDDSIYHQIYPTQEKARLCADAKHFYVVSSGASLVDPGIIMASAGTGNDYLIADYHEEADDKTLDILRKVGAASMAFLKICVYAGLMSDWQFDNLLAMTVQFRVLGYWRVHSMPRRPSEAYGSRMTGLIIHGHIDLGLMVGVVGASLATGETINEAEFMQLMETCTLINDMLDFRGDKVQKQRENVVRHGLRGSACKYLDGSIAKCVKGAAELIGRRKINAGHYEPLQLGSHGMPSQGVRAGPWVPSQRAEGSVPL